MRGPFSRPVFWLFMVIALVAGLALIGTAWWLEPLTAAERALAEGQHDVALQRYGEAEARFNRTPVTRQVLPAAYRVSVDNQMWLLYRLGNHDAVLEKAAVSAPSAAVHFWAGCALFEKARVEEQPEARLGWLGRAEEEFRKSLELNRGDWDTKYNYELTRKLLNELKKNPKTPPKQMLQLLRPQPKAGGQPARRVG